MRTLFLILLAICFVATACQPGTRSPRMFRTDTGMLIYWDVPEDIPGPVHAYTDRGNDYPAATQFIDPEFSRVLPRHRHGHRHEHGHRRGYHEHDPGPHGSRRYHREEPADVLSRWFAPGPGETVDDAWDHDDR